MNPTKKLAAAILFLVAASVFSITELSRGRFSIASCDPRNPANYILYYGNGCPHCKIVEEYIIANNLQEKAGICGKEVWNNQSDQNEFVEKARLCNLDINNLGVPVLWDAKNQKCYEGDQMITDFLKNSSK